MQRRRWGEHSPTNFNVRTIVRKNRALLQPCNRTEEVSVKEQNKNKEKGKDKNVVGCLQ
ncbi:hypothetical protein [Candidatus Phytoplasma sp. AldY-WA1]|uniref:hypothetical protein n=1 Tax=Candidatus Phytoplasma sp. AldY-WA1 TaxID=2852100 RepID=UPI00254BAA03|nr:hypothetical protein [Candidatus Phytoplasma sp. AldY-WA1]